LRLWSAL